MKTASPQNISIEEICSLFEYDKETGMFRWKSLNNRKTTGRKRTVGWFPGGMRGLGYRCIRISSELRIFSHHLAFILVEKKWPKQIDHINRVRDDNRWCNLRECDDYTNKWNRVENRNNKSGHRGVYLDVYETNKYVARIGVNYKKIGLGYYDTFEEAVAARIEGERRYYGEFAPTEEKSHA